MLRAQQKAQQKAAASTLKAELKLQRQVYSSLQSSSALALAAARRDADLASGRIDARVLMEESLAAAWRLWAALRPEEQQALGVFRQPPSSTMQQLEGLLRFPGVQAYLRVAEEDNKLAQGVLTKCSATLYSALCAPLHSVGAAQRLLPIDAVSSIGIHGLTAFAALVALSGRNVGMYRPCGKTVTVLLRVPPVDWHSASVEEVRSSALLPPVAASVELGVTAAALPGESGE
jgi:hypothetical protein